MATTSYVVITGKGTVFNGSNALSLDEVSDGPAATILVVEMSESGIPWMQPRDLPFNQMSLHLNGRSGLASIRSGHQGGEGVNVVMADASTKFLYNRFLTAEMLKGAITPNGGEEPPRF
ncbi:MAG: hypothetical protein HY000_37060 [Planctomycetes bacterium]|nr:hypothetical protein [Planctomycetota bacterium]